MKISTLRAILKSIADKKGDCEVILRSGTTTKDFIISEPMNNIINAVYIEQPDYKPLIIKER